MSDLKQQSDTVTLDATMLTCSAVNVRIVVTGERIMLTALMADGWNGFEMDFRDATALGEILGIGVNRVLDLRRAKA